MKMLRSIGFVFQTVCSFLFRFRKIFLAIPVMGVSIWLAVKNMARLPEMVGLILAADGTFSTLITRSQAVYGPLLLTGACLICMFASRKAFYPWLISVLTLLMPVGLYALNQLGL